MRVDVMHSRCVPAVPGGGQDWTWISLGFDVSVGSQLRDLESPDTVSILPTAVLCKPEYAVIELENSARWPGATLVVSDDRALRVFAPWTSEFSSKVKTQCVVLVRCGTGEQPPQTVAAKD